MYVQYVYMKILYDYLFEYPVLAYDENFSDKIIIRPTF